MYNDIAMIYVTGDVHGSIDFEKLYSLLDYDVTYDDTLVILGDAGICWSEHNDPIVKELYSKIPITVIFVDGNHENFDILNSYPIVNYNGAKMHQISKHIYHVLRGEIMELEGYSFLCIGGACSTDKMLRKEGVSWWKDEEITQKDVDNALKNLKKHDFKVDCIFSHCIDSFTLDKFTSYKSDVSTDMLNFVDEQVSYRYWFFGHYHDDRLIGSNKYCFYESLIILNPILEKKRENF